MRLATKVSAFYLAATATLVLVLAAVALIAFRAFSLTAATAHAQTAAEIVRVHLTEAMLLGTIGERQRFLDRLRDVQNLRSARIVRAPLVDRQFGKNRQGEREPDAIEQRVLETGKSYFETVETLTESYFRATIPYVASAYGIPNCLQCHQVAEGSVLGAITVTIDLNVLRQHAILTIAAIVAIIALFAVSLLWLLNRLLRPITVTADEITEVVHGGVEGRFDRRIAARSSDETGRIAREVNRLLDAISQALAQINEPIARVFGWRHQHDNQLQAAVHAVRTMAAIAHFKQTIEEDREISEIYRRLYRLSRDTSAVAEVSLLECRNDEMHAIGDDGMAQTRCCPGCDPAIAASPELCRAYRTEHWVDGLTDPSLCAAQAVTTHHPDWGYLCFPIRFSGQVGAVLQWRLPRAQQREALKGAEQFQRYLTEAAPVLESKRLLAQLKESALRDPMTGLRNRRFLEESIDLLVSQTLRNQRHLAVMMVDIDFFKVVNDTYGHDAGDAVVRFIAKLLQESVRTSDWVIRYGGEEFLVVLVDTAAEAAIAVAEKIRSQLEKSAIPLPQGQTIQKTLSVGVADFPGDGDAFWQVVKYADVALYHAKETGRNRVVRFTPELWHEKEQY
ncbi:GGDEF domain-containing protein [Hydrogenophilus thermoluteolus]|uniref:diguanylate cyclase n=1 Tax=Hydrogenophilus thermoluteolus TaxID=297 RepID=A0A2Z6DZF1_HYDTE|nr:GGDEF domain-containing protein [Hydrogenophilus thermoluteolus]BBD77718.1 diguanylate cyclase [Hydrogenophilus thermoluteolus]